MDRHRADGAFEPRAPDNTMCVRLRHRTVRPCRSVAQRPVEVLRLPPGGNDAHAYYPDPVAGLPWIAVPPALWHLAGDHGQVLPATGCSLPPLGWSRHQGT